MEILFYTDMHFNAAYRTLDADGIGLHGSTALPLLQAIQDYATEQNIGHMINGGDSVSFTLDQDLYRRHTADYDCLVAQFAGSTSSSLGNHDFHDIIHAFISASVKPTNLLNLGAIDLLTLQPTATKHDTLKLNFDYDFDEFESIVHSSTTDHLIVSSHWSLERDSRILLKQKPYAFTRAKPRFINLLADMAAQGKKIINLAGHEHSFHYSDAGYKTLVMPSPVQSSKNKLEDPCGLFAVLKIDDAGEFSINYKRIVMGARATMPRQPISIDVVNVDQNYMQQYSRQALGRIKPGDPLP